MVMIIIIIEIDVMQQVFSSFSLSSPFSINNSHWQLSSVWRHLYIIEEPCSMMTCHSSSIVVCYLFIVKYEVHHWIATISQERLSSIISRWKTFCLVGIAVVVVENADDHRLFDVNIVLLLLIEKVLMMMMEFV